MIAELQPGDLYVRARTINIEHDEDRWAADAFRAYLKNRLGIGYINDFYNVMDALVVCVNYCRFLGAWVDYGFADLREFDNKLNPLLIIGENAAMNLQTMMKERLDMLRQYGVIQRLSTGRYCFTRVGLQLVGQMWG